jgi:hypothetical protein
MGRRSPPYRRILPLRNSQLRSCQLRNSLMLFHPSCIHCVSIHAFMRLCSALNVEVINAVAPTSPPRKGSRSTMGRDGTPWQSGGRTAKYQQCHRGKNIRQMLDLIAAPKKSCVRILVFERASHASTSAVGSDSAECLGLAECGGELFAMPHPVHDVTARSVKTAQWTLYQPHCRFALSA